MGADPKKEYLDSMRELIIELIDGCQDLTLLDLVYKILIDNSRARG